MKYFLSRMAISTFMRLSLNERWIFDKPKLIQQIDTWESQLHHIKPFYAIKSNPSEEMIQTLYERNVGFDVASKKEIMLAKKYSKDIIFTNPHINRHEDISYLKDTLFKVVDSIEEITKLKDVDVLIRTNSCIESANCNFDSKFGCSQKEAFDIIKYARSCNLKVRGISFHIGSGGIHNRKVAYLKAYAYAEPLLEYLATQYDERPILDIGGGLLPQTNLLETLGWTKYLPYSIIAEPGRYFSEPSYHLLTQIISKTKRGIFLDNGIYHELNVYHRDHWTFPLLTHCYDEETNQLTEITQYEIIKIFGPTCDSYDTLNECKLPQQLKEGDYIFLENMGAYTSAGSCDFNGIVAASSKN